MWQRRVGFPSMGMAGWCGLVLGLAFWMPLAVLCGILWAACWLVLRLARLADWLERSLRYRGGRK